MPHPLFFLLLGTVLIFAPHPSSIPSFQPSASRFEIGEPIDPPTTVHLSRHRAPLSPLAPLTPRSHLQRPHPTPPPPPPPPLALPWANYSASDAHPLPRSLLVSPFMSRLLVSPAHAFLFCPLFHSHHHSLLSHLPAPLFPLSSFSLRDRDRLLSSPTILRFLFVRHPLSHLLFIYLNATSSPLSSSSYHTFMSKLRQSPIPQNAHELQKVSFPFLLTFLSRQGPENAHPLFQSQTRLCGYGQVAYAFVGTVENFRHHVADLDHRLQFTTTRALATPDQLTDKSVEEARRVFQSRRLMNKAVKFYADDFKNFHYDPHVIL